MPPNTEPTSPRPTLKPFLQERDYTCAVACLRTVSATFGVQRTEDELLPLCRTTEDGTHRDDLIAAAQGLGFETRHGRLTLDDLRSATYPIVYIDRTPVDGVAAIHSLVIIEVGDPVKTFDPKFGEREIPLAAFEWAWRLCRNFGIILQPRNS